MAEELRNIFNQDFIQQLEKVFKQEYPTFEEGVFLELIYDDKWPELALKQRVRHITTSLHQTLPMDYSDSLALLKKVAPQFQGGLAGIIFPDYVEVYGLDDWDESVSALEYFTPLSTSEFAVRPFVMKDQDKMINQFLEWSNHSNEHVRRLASEGSRPRLPWGVILTTLKEDPLPIIPILENLKEDKSLYVRKSVANNLNDISRDHPTLVLDLAKGWYGVNEETNWIIKRGLRTLMRQGNQQALELIGFPGNPYIDITEIQVTDSICIGESITFSFQLTSTDQMKSNKVRIEYAIEFVKANGKHSSKIFKVAETAINHREIKLYKKRHSFKNLTTRKHYPGKHKLSIIVNGEVKGSKYFDVE